MKNRSAGRVLAPAAVVLFGVLAAGAACFLLFTPESEGPLLKRGEETATPPTIEENPYLSVPEGAPLREAVPRVSVKERERGLFPVEEAREAVPPTLLSASIHGTVKDEKEKPIHGAVVRLESIVPGDLDPLLPITGYSRKTVTNDRGRFEIPLPREGVFRLQVRKKGYAPGTVLMALPGDDLDIRLSQGITLAGLVMEKKTRAPLSGAWVRVGYPMPGDPVETDEKGFFTLSELREGSMNVECFMPGYDVKRVFHVFVKKGAENFLEITLEPGAPLEGFVLEQGTNHPLPGVSVTYAIGFKEGDGVREVERKVARTDREGFFHFDPLSRKGYRLRVQAPGYGTALLKPFKEHGKPGALVKIHLMKEGAVAGTVFDPRGNPLAGAEVRVFTQDLWEKKEIRTGSERNGRFLLAPAAPGEITLFASHPDFGPASLPGLLLKPGETLEGVEITLPLPARIRGEVTGPDGLPVADARVVIDGVRPMVSRLYGVLPVTYTGPSGGFMVEHLPQGTYRVSASHQNRRSPVQEVIMAPGEEAALSLCLAEGLAVQGKVTDSAGIPLDDVLVTGFAASPGEARRFSKALKRTITRRLDARRPRPEETADRPWITEQAIFQRRSLTRFRGMTRTGPEGLFLLDGFLPNDEVVLRFWKPGYTPRTLTGIAPAQEEVTLSLNPMGAVEGTVMDRSTGLPVREFKVSLSPTARPAPLPRKGKGRARKPVPPPPREQGFRTENGAFRIEAVRTGGYTIRVFAKGFQASKPLRVDVTPEYPVPYVNLFMEHSGALYVKVLGGDRAPVSGVAVSIRPMEVRPPPPQAAPSPSGKKGNKKQKGGNKKGKARNKPGPLPKGGKRGRTDAQGRCVFPGLKPGTYFVLVGFPEHPLTKPKTVRVDPGKRAGTTFILSHLGVVELSVRDDAGFSLRPVITLSGSPGGVFRKIQADKVGVARFPNLIPGRYKLKVECKGFASRTLHIRIKADQRVKEEITLLRKPPVH